MKVQIHILFGRVSSSVICRVPLRSGNEYEARFVDLTVVMTPTDGHQSLVNAMFTIGDFRDISKYQWGNFGFVVV
jgi:hypothetical protein